jgi:uncharacterized radical SAM superfamily Fe-S cluster-containing enzyme
VQRRQQGIKYREKNKAKLYERNKLYRKENKEVIKMNKSAKCLCLCGISHTHGHESRHRKSNHHTEFMNRLNSKNIFVAYKAILEMESRRNNY